MVFLGPPLRDITAHKQISNNNRCRSRKISLVLAKDSEEDFIHGTTATGSQQGSQTELPSHKRGTRGWGRVCSPGAGAAGRGRAVLRELS